jgi:hypothetical protein
MSDLEHALRVGANIESCLEEKKRRIYEELRNYPTPITACDQQFNYLLEQQAEIVQKLARLKGLLAETHTHNDPRSLLGSFIQSIECLDEDTKREWIERLAAATDVHTPPAR